MRSSVVPQKKRMSEMAFIMVSFRNRRGEVISANYPLQPAPQRLGLFGCAAMFVKPTNECQEFFFLNFVSDSTSNRCQIQPLIVPWREPARVA